MMDLNPSPVRRSPTQHVDPSRRQPAIGALRYATPDPAITSPGAAKVNASGFWSPASSTPGRRHQGTVQHYNLQLSELRQTLDNTLVLVLSDTTEPHDEAEYPIDLDLDTSTFLDDDDAMSQYTEVAASLFAHSPQPWANQSLAAAGERDSGAGSQRQARGGFFDDMPHVHMPAMTLEVPREEEDHAPAAHADVAGPANAPASPVREATLPGEGAGPGPARVAHGNGAHRANGNERSSSSGADEAVPPVVTVVHGSSRGSARVGSNGNGAHVRNGNGATQEWTPRAASGGAPGAPANGQGGHGKNGNGGMPRSSAQEPAAPVVSIQHGSGRGASATGNGAHSTNGSGVHGPNGTGDGARSLKGVGPGTKAAAAPAWEGSGGVAAAGHSGNGSSGSTSRPELFSGRSRSSDAGPASTVSAGPEPEQPPPAQPGHNGAQPSMSNGTGAGAMVSNTLAGPGAASADTTARGSVRQGAPMPGDMREDARDSAAGTHNQADAADEWPDLVPRPRMQSRSARARSVLRNRAGSAVQGADGSSDYARHNAVPATTNGSTPPGHTREQARGGFFSAPTTPQASARAPDQGRAFFDAPRSHPTPAFSGDEQERGQTRHPVPAPASAKPEPFTGYAGLQSPARVPSRRSRAMLSHQNLQAAQSSGGDSAVVATRRVPPGAGHDPSARAKVPVEHGPSQRRMDRDDDAEELDESQDVQAARAFSHAAARSRRRLPGDYESRRRNGPRVIAARRSSRGDAHARARIQRLDAHNLSTFSVPTLRRLGKDVGVEGYRDLSKPDLVVELLAAVGRRLSEHDRSAIADNGTGSGAHRSGKGSRPAARGGGGAGDAAAGALALAESPPLVDLVDDDFEHLASMSLPQLHELCEGVGLEDYLCLRKTDVVTRLLFELYGL